MGTNMPSLFDAPMKALKRTNLKRDLVKAADAKDEAVVISIIDELSAYNPTPIPTLGLMNYKIEDASEQPTSSAPLAGRWRLLFTNAKDAEAPSRTEKNSDQKFGDEVAQGVEVKTGQRIDAPKGECVNFIKLSGDSESRPFDELEITIKMTPLTDTRVRLDFMSGRALNEKAPLPFLKDFKFKFPPPTFGDFTARLRGKDPRIEPQAYFDILYVDEDIRVHRTGEGKVFVQLRD